jgi:cell division protein FtsB
MRIIKKLLFLLFFFFFFYSLTKSLFDYQKKLDFYQSYKKEYEKEKKRNITLKTEILKNADQYQIEKTIRNNLNYLRPEEVAVIVPKPSPTPPQIILTPVPPWRQWTNLFFSL